MNSSEKVISDFENNTREFVEVLSSFTQDQLNVVPFEGSWTAGKVGRHVFKALVGMPKTLEGPVTKTERKPDELIEPIDKIFLDFTKKLNAPSFIIPEDREYNRQEMTEALTDKITQTIITAKPLDLTASTAFELPTFGLLTRHELLHFAGVHTKRHTRQLRKIREHLTATAS
jgi:hypothetical protein